jgi:hypothetical protein
MIHLIRRARRGVVFYGRYYAVTCCFKPSVMPPQPAKQSSASGVLYWRFGMRAEDTRKPISVNGAHAAMRRGRVAWADPFSGGRTGRSSSGDLSVRPGCRCRPSAHQVQLDYVRNPFTIHSGLVCAPSRPRRRFRTHHASGGLRRGRKAMKLHFSDFAACFAFSVSDFATRYAIRHSRRS